jgi:7-cyano-7-deazaguanine reductase
VTLNGSIAGAGMLHVSYVPDQHILKSGSFESYLRAIGAVEWSSPEAAAVAILHDLNNELVARWVQVTLGSDAYRVTIEDRQPRWDNREMLSRLGRP